MSLQRNAGAVRRFARAMRFGNWLQSLPGRLMPAPFRLLQIGSAYWQSRALWVAARLDLATALGDETLSAHDLASRVGADGDALGRLLRMLAALGVFEETSPMMFRNTRLSRPLRHDAPDSVRAMILLHNAEPMARPWFDQLEAGIRSGASPFARSHGERLFDYLDHHPDFDRQFSEAMDSVEALAGDGFATDFAWDRFTRVIDVGGSRGRKALTLLQRHPHLEAWVVDRPQVIAEARRYWSGRQADALERLHFVPGDLFDAVPAATDAGDVYLLSAVLHGFDDADCVRALTRLCKAVGHSGARVAVLEIVLPPIGADLACAAIDMQMFVGSNGRERTLDEWIELARRGGFVLDERIGLRSLGQILLFRAA